MKGTDKFLVGIVVGIVVIVIAAFTLALAQTKPTYRDDSLPDGVAFNYLLAIQQRDFARAYAYLAPTMPSYPASPDAFESQVYRDRYSFRLDESLTLDIGAVRVYTETADVTMRETSFAPGGFLMGSSRSSTFLMRLARDKTGAWRISHSDRFWRYCWDLTSGCKD